jgi:Rrf2 family transcriptional regulator, nitric oxide-sensitive transcriptional repressor
MISQSAEYSLRAVLVLAAHAPRPLTIRQVADAAHIPAGYLAKVLSALGRAGIVNSQRGVHGGFVLNRPPESLSLLELIRVADPSRRLTECPLKLDAHRHRLCSLHRRLDQATALAESALAGTTVADLLKDQDPCGFAAPALFGSLEGNGQPCSK